MTVDNLEIEAKYRISEETARCVAAELARRGATATRHEDQYFDRHPASFLDVEPVREWLSVRSRGDRVSINHKLWHFGPTGVADYCTETEVAISSAQDAASLFIALGFAHLVTVHKKRIQSLWQPGFIVALDEIEGLGWYVEIEVDRSTNFQATALAARGLQRLAARMGLDESSRDRLGYPRLLLRRKGMVQ